MIIDVDEEAYNNAIKAVEQYYFKDKEVMKKSKKLSLFLRSLLISKEAAKNSEGNMPSIIISSAENSHLNNVQEQQVPWKFKEQSLVDAFEGDPPIVYGSHFGTRIVGVNKDETDEKSDAYVVRKQDQYGYEGKDTPKIEEDEFDKEFNTIAGEITLKIDEEKRRAANTTVSFLTEQQKFEQRWNEIKEQVESEKFKGIEYKE